MQGIHIYLSISDVSAHIVIDISCSLIAMAKINCLYA